MTRTRADYATLAPTEQTALYYAQRASPGGLLITEATHISPEATPVWTIYSAVREGGGHVPGIWTNIQTQGWREVVDAVHDQRALISCQLLHAGRVAQPGIGDHPIVRGTGAQLPSVSSSATALCPGQEGGDYSWDLPAVEPRALETDEIARVIDDYRRAARNAVLAGFDFVEVHAAHGFPLSYLMLTEPRVGALSLAPEADGSQTQPLRNARFRKIYRGMLIGAGGFTPRTAEAAVADGIYDLVAFGRWFLANPDLPGRLLAGTPLNVYDRKTFYGAGAEGYTDYPNFSQTGAGRSGKYPLIDQSQIGTSLKGARNKHATR